MTPDDFAQASAPHWGRDVPAAVAAAADRLHAGVREMSVATSLLEVAGGEAVASMRRFAAAWQESEDRQVAEHPDLAELNVMLDGFYSS